MPVIPLQRAYMTPTTQNPFSTASPLGVITCAESWAEPSWAKFTPDRFLSTAARKRDLFPPNLMYSPNSASARWNLYGLAEQNEASLEGEKKAYVTGICVAAPHRTHTPACFGSFSIVMGGGGNCEISRLDWSRCTAIFNQFMSDAWGQTYKRKNTGPPF